MMDAVQLLELAPVDLTVPDEPPHDGVMIAWIAPDGVGEKFVVDHPDAEPANRMHMTIAYLGKASELDISQRILADSVLRDFASTFVALSAKVSGTGFFETPGDGTAVVALIDSPGLPDLYVNLIKQLESVELPVSHTHGWCPHVTLAYVPDDQTDLRAPTGFTFTIDNLSLVIADEGESYPLR